MLRYTEEGLSPPAWLNRVENLGLRFYADSRQFGALSNILRGALVHCSATSTLESLEIIIVIEWRGWALAIEGSLAALALTLRLLSKDLGQLKKRITAIIGGSDDYRSLSVRNAWRYLDPVFEKPMRLWEVKFGMTESCVSMRERKWTSYLRL